MDTPKADVATKPFKIALAAWTDKKAKLKTKFSQLNDSDLHFEEGKEGELTARLQTKLSKSQVDVQKLISEI